MMRLAEGIDAEAGVGVQAEQGQGGAAAVQGQEQADREQAAHEDGLHAHPQRRGHRDVAGAQARRPRHPLVELVQEEALTPAELDLLHAAQALLQRLLRLAIEPRDGLAPAGGGVARDEQRHQEHPAHHHHRHQGHAGRRQRQDHDDAGHHERLARHVDQ